MPGLPVWRQSGPSRRAGGPLPLLPSLQASRPQSAPRLLAQIQRLQACQPLQMPIQGRNADRRSCDSLSKDFMTRFGNIVFDIPSLGAWFGGINLVTDFN